MMSNEERWKALATKPRLKVFLSADIVGSTPYKQSFALDADKPRVTAQSVHERKLWQATITEFYEKISDRFPVIWGTATSKLAKKEGESDDQREIREIMCGDRPYFWKTVGDEVIFWKELTHECQLWFLLKAWMDCIAELRADLKGKSLDIKSTIWTAEFPVRNSAILLKNDDHKLARSQISAGVPDPLGMMEFGDDDSQLGRYYENPDRSDAKLDFIGPGIDIGFRIATLSSLKRTILSVDVAHLLAMSYLTTAQSGRDIPSGLIRSAKVTKHIGSIEPMITGILVTDQYAIAESGNKKLSDVNIHYSGSEPLKGILGGIKYPKFWINSVGTGTFEAMKDNLYLKDGERIGPSWAEIYSFCVEFYKDRKRYIRPPLILGKDINDESGNRDWSSTYQEKLYKDYVLGHQYSQLSASERERLAA